MAAADSPSERQALAEVPLDTPEDATYDPSSGTIHVLCAGPAVRSFNVFLKEIPAALELASWPTEPASVTVDGELHLPVWSGRVLRIQVEPGTMVLSGGSWEDPPRLTWGPGWALVEWRTADPQFLLQWRRLGEDGSRGELQEETPVCDRWDGVRRRAWLKSLKAGERLELRYRPSGLSFPPRDWTSWQELVVPDVDPAGARPTVGLPTG